MISDNLTIPTVQKLIDAGWPVWVSFRRCRRGVCGIYGQLWGGPEGDYFGRVAQQLEQIGAGAILINCLRWNVFREPCVVTGFYPVAARCLSQRRPTRRT